MKRVASDAGSPPPLRRSSRAAAQAASSAIKKSYGGDRIVDSPAVRRKAVAKGSKNAAPLPAIAATPPPAAAASVQPVAAAASASPVVPALAPVLATAPEEKQKNLDTLVDGYFEELMKPASQQRPTDLESAKQQLLAVSELMERMEKEKAEAEREGLDVTTLQLYVDQATGDKQTLQNEVFLAEEAAKAEEQRRQAEQRRLREEEATRRRAEEERAEKLRMEASMIDKECKICFDEMENGVGCVPCGNMLGCKDCVDKWVLNNPSCPFCRCKYKNVNAQIKPKAEMKARKAPAVATRRSTRLNGLPSLN